MYYIMQNIIGFDSEGHQLWCYFFHQAKLTCLYMYMQNVLMSKLKWRVITLSPVGDGNLNTEFSHLGMSVSICLFLSALLLVSSSYPRRNLNNLPSLQFIVRQDDSNHALGLAPHVKIRLAALQSRMWLMGFKNRRPTGEALLSALNPLNLTK